MKIFFLTMDFRLNHIFIFVAVLHILVNDFSSAQEFIFNRSLVGVAFSPYVKNWEARDIPGHNSYSISDIKIMLRLIHNRFSKITTYSIGAELPGRFPKGDARVSVAAAELNRDEDRDISIIQGVKSYEDPVLQNLEISNALNISANVNSVYPKTVTGIVFSENLDLLQILLRIKQENSQVWGNLKLSSRISNCTVDTNSLRQHVNACDVILCKIYPDPSCDTTSLAVNSVVEQFNQSLSLIQSINPNVQVYIGETGWPSFGKDTKKYNVANLKDYWERIGAWAEEFNENVFMFEAFDQPWRSNPNIENEDHPFWRYAVAGHFGWWKRTDSFNNNPNSYIEKIIELPKFVETGGNMVLIVSILLPIVSLIVIGTLIFYLQRLKRAREALLRLKLTDEEIIEFQEGPSDSTNEPWNLPYQKEYEIPKDELRIHMNAVLGSGAFGIVYHGFVGKVDEKEVAVKTIKSGSTAKELRNLLSEIKIMIYIGKHDNIVGLIGAQTADLKLGSVYLAAEFCGSGSLEKYLRKYPYYNPSATYANVAASEKRKSETEYQNAPDQTAVSFDNNFDDVRYVNGPTQGSQPSTQITMSDLLTWSYQIANGMEFLGTKNVIHADLAARNILLTKQKVAKITDFGLSRKLYEYTQYVKKNQEPLPWRWMAIESLRNMTFSSQSDIWSYGVLLWELYSLGGIPYPGLSWDISFLEQLDNGLRMSQPKLASPEIYQQMLNTWQVSPTNRPSFTMLKNFFMQECMNLSQTVI